METRLPYRERLNDSDCVCSAYTRFWQADHPHCVTLSLYVLEGESSPRHAKPTQLKIHCGGAIWLTLETIHRFFSISFTHSNFSGSAEFCSLQSWQKQKPEALWFADLAKATGCCIRQDSPEKQNQCDIDTLCIIRNWFKCDYGGWGVPASWRPRKAGDTVWRPETTAVSPSGGRSLMSQPRKWGPRSHFLCLFVPLRPSLVKWGPPRLGRAICFPQATESVQLHTI